MQTLIEWFRANPDVFGFLVASFIFLVTVFLVAFRKIQFWVMLILLIFSLVAGLTITNQNKFFSRMESSSKVIEDQ